MIVIFQASLSLVRTGNLIWLICMSQTCGLFSKLSVVEDVEVLSDSEVIEVLVYFITPKNKILLKENIDQLFNLILNTEHEFKQLYKNCNALLSIVHQMSIGNAMNAIMWPTEPEAPYDSWQAVKKEFTQNHTAVRSELKHSQSIGRFSIIFLCWF